MTQLESARKGVITPEMIRVAVRENVTPEFIRDGVARGAIVIPANVRHLTGSGGAAPRANAELRTMSDVGSLKNGHVAPSATHSSSFGSAQQSSVSGRSSTFDVCVGHPTATPDANYWVNQTVSQRRAWLFDPAHCRGENAPKRLDPTGIGRCITTKINANQGASPVSSNTEEELDKLRHAILYGADTVMDLSTGGRLDECRQAIIDNSVVPVGTVPIYSMIIGKRIEDLDYNTILREVEHQAQQGVDYFTIHAGVLKEHLPLIRNRITGLVSRGGSLLAKWMIHHNKQNPMYELFDEISAIMRQYDVTYSLGDGVRPGCLADASDPAQIAELHVLGELVQRARADGVQVMVEGPGHVPLNEIAWNMEHQRVICDDAPFYVLGPLVTDVFPGYDHITSAIGATEAARAGAAMLCYVTPKEHVGLPKAADVKAGCIAYKIAAHAGDIARGIRAARQWDDDLSKARAALNWPKHFELAFDGETARALHDEDLEVDTDFCAMCGHDWCSMRISKEIAEWASGKAQGFVPLKIAAKSPGLSREQIEFLAHRGKKHDCHSDNVADGDEAKRVQGEYIRRG
ncbi:MAG: phosphomethylpyrimidine synthase ThiC [Phycisphaerales bacterium]|nr:phosphomethylpyrimidine synthase ThiC [Phycisphaerales bacterium]